MTVNDAATGSVHAARGLPGGGVLLAAEMGWFRFDPEQARIVPAGDPAQAPMPSRGVSIRGPMDVTRDLPDGGVLIGATNRALHYASAPAVCGAGEAWEANLSGLPLRREVAIRMSPSSALAHLSAITWACARRLADGAVYAEVPVEFPSTRTLQKPKRFSPLRSSSRPGSWTLQCAKERRQSRPSFHPDCRPINPSIGERLASAWQITIGVVGALRTSPSSSCSARDATQHASFHHPERCRLGQADHLAVFPSSSSPRSSAVGTGALVSQRPRHNATRCTLRRSSRFEQRTGARAGIGMLGRVRDQSRLWLQGRSGMGKTSVLPLESAPILLRPMRRPSAPSHANTASFWSCFQCGTSRPFRRPIRTSRRPGYWKPCVAALSSSGSQRGPGVDQGDAELGHIALAMDGMNEADRDPALATFARQFPRVRIVVTSRALATRPGRSGACLRRSTPCVISLTMWLGQEKGAVLSRRIVAEGLLETITSGYDLGLVCDLVGDNPEQAAVPADRVELYRAMLARAQILKARRCALGAQGACLDDGYTAPPSNHVRR